VTSERWKRIDRLFAQAVEAPPEERPALLQREAGDDSSLAREVASLIEAHERGGAFLEEPVHGGAMSLLGMEDDRALIGRRIGAYRIMSLLGSGGMGAVYLGARDDETYEQLVAIKVVRRAAAGSSSKDVEDLRRRFRLERQVLADLEHPLIARLLDAGETDDERPYLVMEHVAGEPIDVHCDRGDLSIPQRLSVFQRVCEAVQHAHQRLIVHRDLKPSNILVTKDGSPKLLDFGLAKLLDPHRRAFESNLTADGRVMGTIAYAAPEQVTSAGPRQDTRSDVYALGMILYRLLAGREAYSVRGAMDEVLDRITSAAPDPPSTYNPAVSRDLDTIVLEAIDKDRERRYQSADDLADDVQRFLAGEPIVARSDSQWYVLRKTARRYRWPLSIAVSALLLITIVAAAMTIQSARLAERSTQLAAALRTSNIERGRALGAMGALSEAEQALWTEMLTPSVAAARDQAARWALRELYFEHPCVMSIPGEGRLARAVHVAADGRWIVAVGAPGLTVFDAATGEVVRRIDSEEPLAGATAVDEEGRRLIAVTTDGRVVEWDLPTGRVVRRLPPIDGEPHSIDLTRGGRALLVATASLLQIIDRRTGRDLAPAIRVDSAVRTAAAAWNGSVLAAACADGRVRVFDGASGALLAEYLDSPRHPPRSLALSEDGRFLAADQHGADVALIDLLAESAPVILRQPGGWITSIRFASPPTTLVATSADKSLYAWEAPSGRLLAQHTHPEDLQGVAITPGASFAVATEGNALRVWNVAAQAAVERWSLGGTVFDVHIMPNQERVLIATGDGDNRIYEADAATGAALRVFEGHTDAVASIEFNPADSTLYSGGYEGTIRKWSLRPGAGRGGEVLVAIEGSGRQINSISLSPDGALIAAGSDDGVVRIWRTDDGALLRSITPRAKRIPRVAFSPDGETLAIACASPNEVVLYDVDAGRPFHRIEHADVVRVVRYSDDGALLASAGDDLAVHVWSMKSGEVGRRVARLTGHRQDVFALAFAPDARTLASAGRSGVLKFWDIRAGRCLATLAEHRDMVFALEFGRGGNRLLTGSRDRSVGSWDLDRLDAPVRGNRRYWSRRLGPTDAGR